MGRDLSFEHPDYCFFGTIRTASSRLWFVNDPKLEERFLAYLARYIEIHGVIVFAFVLMGNHYHLLARFPKGNKAAFFRDLNGMFSRLTKARVRSYEGGKLWARRVRTQVVPNNEDILDRFFYTALNPISAGLVEKVSDYPAYNSFSDSIRGKSRLFKVVEWQKYNARKQKNPSVTVQEFTKVHKLTYARLPGFESMSQKEYSTYMNEEYERRRIEIVKRRKESGLGFATPKILREQEPGTKPRSTKTSTRNSHRPLVLTRCPVTKKQIKKWYFELVAAFKTASLKFRAGMFTTVFPPGTYRPWTCCAC